MVEKDVRGGLRGLWGSSFHIRSFSGQMHRCVAAIEGSTVSCSKGAATLRVPGACTASILRPVHSPN